MNQVGKFSFSHITYFDGFCSVIFYFHDWPAAVYTFFQPSSPFQQWAFDSWLLSRRYITRSCFLTAVPWKLQFSNEIEMKLNKTHFCDFWFSEILIYTSICIVFWYIIVLRHIDTCTHMCIYKCTYVCRCVHILVPKKTFRYTFALIRKLLSHWLA